MQLFCRNGAVFASHDDGQTVPADAYPGCIRIVVPDDTVLEKVGAPPVDGAPDLRPYAAPPVDLVAYTADKRWQVETGGIMVGGVPVATDDRSKTMIIGARIKADRDPAFNTKWKTPAGFLMIDAPTIIAISDAVLAHVDACFAAEAIVLDEIEAGAITAVTQIDEANWPG